MISPMSNSQKPEAEIEISPLTDDRVQSSLIEAEGHLWSLIEGRNMDDSPRIWIAFTVLRSVRMLSKSSNGIPGFRGLGLKEALELADSINEHKPTSDRDLTIHSYKHLAAGIAVGS